MARGGVFKFGGGKRAGDSGSIEDPAEDPGARPITGAGSVLSVCGDILFYCCSKWTLREASAEVFWAVEKQVFFIR